MIPLTVTIVIIYGLIGFLGKDFDMPVAVLSSLTLGLSIDFAIHFIERAKLMNADYGNWLKTHFRMFQEPARAIYRNALVIGIGFLPLLVAPLIPYKTVGFFMSLIMLTSSLVTMLVLPSAINIMQEFLLGTRLKVNYHNGVYFGLAVATVFGTAYFIQQYKMLSKSTIAWIVIGFSIISIVMCQLFTKGRGGK